MARKPILERFRTPIVAIIGVAAVALVAVWAFTSTSAAAYSCAVEFQTPGNASPDPEAASSGFVQESMGNGHVTLGQAVSYLYCPPASGSHFNVEGRGPLQSRVYGPGDPVSPQGWIHNLEHGALVVLYRGRDGDPGLTEETQQALREFATSLPDSPVCGRPANQYIVIARFDDMATPFAALVWGRVLPLQAFEPETIEAFWMNVGEQAATMPERFGCPLPAASPSGGPAASPGPS